MNTLTLGIDNGVTGSLAGISDKCLRFLHPVPVTKSRDFTQRESNTTHINVPSLVAFLLTAAADYDDVQVVMERPLRNPRLFAASLSAAASYEATRIALAQALAFAPVTVLDSRNWQHALLPGVKGSKALKLASAKLCDELFPGFRSDAGLKDGDSALMALWFERQGPVE